MRNIFNNSNIGKRLLGAGIGSNECGEKYVKNFVNDWNNQLVLLLSIPESQIQVAYLAFVSGFKTK